VRKLFEHPQFQHLVKKKQILTGAPAADPFLIASAYVRKACVVTEETKGANTIRIPDACEHFSIVCRDLEGLMEQEGWTF
jgi:hypothetical protein